MTDRLVVITPWYPSEQHPFEGAFVRSCVQAVRPFVGSVEVIHVTSVPPDSDAVTGEFDDDGVPVTYLPVPLDPMTPRADVAHAHAAALVGAGIPDRLQGAMVHAHVGMPTGGAVASVLPPSTPFVATEHASYLTKVLRHPDSREMYGALLDRAARVLAVSEVLRRSIIAVFPQAAAKVAIVPNPVAFDALPPRPTPVTELRRWLYLGHITEAKGSDRLLRAFAHAHAQRPDITLSVVGRGPLAEELAAWTAERGLGAAVRFPGPVPPDAVPSLLAEHDLLVHLSRFETFGVTCVEALVSGLPVVATRCGGPEHVLADQVGGPVELVAVGDSVDDVVTAVERLESRLPGVDLLAARRALESRLSAPTVGRALTRHYEAAQSGSAGVRPPRTLVVALAPHRRPDLVERLSAATAAGGTAALVTTAPRAWAPLPPDVDVFDVACTPLATTVLSPRPAQAAIDHGLAFARRVTGGLNRRTSNAQLTRLLLGVDRRVRRLQSSRPATAVDGSRPAGSWREAAALLAARGRLRIQLRPGPRDVIVGATPRDTRLARLLAKRSGDQP